MGDSCTGSERGMSCFNTCSSGIQEVTLIKQKKHNMIHEKKPFSQYEHTRRQCQIDFVFCENKNSYFIIG